MRIEEYLHAAMVDGGWPALAGLTCTCPPGCTVGDTWGDGPRPCATDCQPCRIMAGKPYVKRKKTKPRPIRERVSLYEKPIDTDEIDTP